MKSLALASLLALAAACGHDDDHGAGDLVLLDDASDEAFATLADLVSRGEVETNDDVAMMLTAPADGATLTAAAEPATFEWAPPQSTARHGRATGDFTWCRIDCPGTDEPIDVIAIETREWTADAERWAKITSATGACTVTMVSAYIDRGVVTEGPYTPTSTTTFSVAAE